MAGVSVTVDGTKFNADEATFSIGTSKDAKGMPMSDTMDTSVKVLVDLFDVDNFPFDSIKQMFDLAKIPNRDKLKEVKVEYWKDEKGEDVICSYKFKGWIKRFLVQNPVFTMVDQPLPGAAANRTHNHILFMEIIPEIQTGALPAITISN